MAAFIRLLMLLATLLFSNAQGPEDFLPTDFNLHPQVGEHVYVLPATAECELEASDVCTSLVKRCGGPEPQQLAGVLGSAECEIECLAKEPPKLSDACVKSHPCAADVESLCADVTPGNVMKCLHDAR
jgi:hypothetical protein